MKKRIITYAVVISLATLMISACEYKMAEKPCAELLFEPQGDNIYINEEDLYKEIKSCFLSKYISNGEEVWRSRYDDKARANAGNNILMICEAVGYDTANVYGNELAQKMDAHFEEDESRSIWETACDVIGIVPDDMVSFYEYMDNRDSDTYYWTDIDGGVWRRENFKDDYVGPKADYFVKDGECFLQ